LIHQNLRAALEATGVIEEGKLQSPQAASAVMSAFEGAKLRFFGHLLAGLKTPSLLASIRDDLAQGRSSVVQVVSTNEAVMERRLARDPGRGMEQPDHRLTPKDQVLDYLMGAFPTQAMIAVEDESGAVTMVPLMKDGAPVLSQQALVLRDELVTHLACLPGRPRRARRRPRRAGPRVVAEITGRSRRVLLREGRRVVERRSSTAAKAETDAFMSGKKRVLVFSDAGGTGRSYHADLAVANQQRRVHYLVEPGWRADAAIQGLGRSHRTNQASAPLFRPVTTDIHGEKRFLSTIARRLDSLGALTRGERRTAGNGLFRAEDNLESPWAYRALQAFYVALHFGNVEAMDRETFEAKTGLRLLDHEGNLQDVRRHAADEHLPQSPAGPADRRPERPFRHLRRDPVEHPGARRGLGGARQGHGGHRRRRPGGSGRGGDPHRCGHRGRDPDGAVRRCERPAPWSTSRRRWRDGSRRPALRVNGKSGRAALVVQGLTTTNDDDRLIQAVRLIRPEKRSVAPLKGFEESAWEAGRTKPPGAPPGKPSSTRPIRGCRASCAGDRPAAAGLVEPSGPTDGSVRRLKAPDGRRWLGRVLEPSQAPG
jgi:hypothetical protein